MQYVLVSKRNPTNIPNLYPPDLLANFIFLKISTFYTDYTQLLKQGAKLNALNIIAIFSLLITLMVTCVGLIFFPFLTIVECTNSLQSKTKKTAWILMMLLTWPLGSLCYGLFASEKKTYRGFAVFTSAIFLLSLLVTVVDKQGVLSALSKSKFEMLVSKSLQPRDKKVDGSTMSMTTKELNASLKCMNGIPKATVQKKYAEAIKDFTDGINLAPNSLILADCYLLRGKTYQTLGKVEAANEDFKKTIILAKENLKISENKASVLITLSDASDNRKDYPSAIEYLKKAMQLEPKQYGYKKYDLEQLQNKMEAR